MKKILNLMMSVSVVLLLEQNINAQVSTLGNAGFPVDYVGWDAVQFFPLNVTHRGAQNINFRTDYAAAIPGLGNRMIITDGGFGPLTGRIAMGNNLPDGFAPVDRLHLNQNTGTTAIRFTNGGFGFTANNGLQIGNDIAGAAFINQYEVQTFKFSNRNLPANPIVSRFEIVPTGNTMIGTPGAAPEYVIQPANAFSQVPLALLNVRGPINSCAPLGSGVYQKTIIYGYTTPQADPSNIANDGFRMKFDWDFKGVNRDSWVFEKTDGQSPDPDGCIVFTATGNDTIEELSFAINGMGRSYAGKNIAVVPGLKNRFTIDAELSDNTPSGLQFTDINALSAPVPNVGNMGVLALDLAGNVIYVPGGGGSTFFTCGTSVAADLLPFDSWWELNNKNFVFSGQGTLGNNVGIGTSCTPTAKLDVLQNSGATGTKGILVTNNDPSTSQIVGSSIGIKSIMPFINDPYRIAGYFSSPQLPGTASTAIYVPVNGGNVVIGYPSLNTAGAKLEVNGNIYAFGTLYPSDQTLKTNVQTITNASSIIYNLRPVSYEWNTSIIADSTMYGTHYGFIAQEVDTVLPSIVHEDHNGIKSVSYTEVIPYLVAALKAEHFRNDSLATALANLTATVNGCCNSNARTQNPNLNQTDVTLTNSESVVLNQNVPNPFAEQTTITYNLPESVQKAQLLFYDATGKLIKSVDLTARGNGQINVFANDLSNGIYSYALIVDGQIADTKRMVKTN